MSDNIPMEPPDDQLPPEFVAPRPPPLRVNPGGINWVRVDSSVDRHIRGQWEDMWRAVGATGQMRVDWDPTTFIDPNTPEPLEGLELIRSLGRRGVRRNCERNTYVRVPSPMNLLRCIENTYTSGLRGDEYMRTSGVVISRQDEKRLFKKFYTRLSDFKKKYHVLPKGVSLGPREYIVVLRAMGFSDHGIGVRPDQFKEQTGMEIHLKESRGIEMIWPEDKLPILCERIEE